ncbi:centrosomal protein of 170 kDa protein B isoform X2 [Sinocyclocheilus anshuiensis]|uniref:centrosomal protein of 170 kDa protein B isoform X2 n=1 Tax=Sinocyclocheilus anshuiensis TaxID=1608454 RepID=UPI0007B94AAB|nr:PREDICTED: centrosomal protein of 170 kDa protein B-like isoform X2 [Sinocyclocheilus anshuiensis]
MSVTSWFLVSSSGTRHRLPREMIFVGREDCELMLQSRSVDKQHAVINYNPATDEHLVKDLGSLNGTFVNDLRIPDQTYITLKLSDIVRFGYDSHVYILEKSQHKVPEEALKHEKYTSQLQMGIKSTESKQQNLQEEKSKLERSERKSLTESPVPRPTPLYGQPSWWGEEDSGNKEAHNEVRRSGESHSDITKEAPTAEYEFNISVQEIHDGQAKSTYPYHREPSYFEIPTKEFHIQPKSPATDLIDIPTKDTNVPLISTPPVVQSHASFTIEFDDCMPGKIKIKDHVTKFSSRQRSKQQQQHSLVATPTEVLSAESKVADWLVQSDVSMMCRRPPCEDVYSTKSDLAMHIRTLKGHHHEDGTQSDSEDPVMKEQCSKSHRSMQSQSSVQSHQSAQSRKSEPSESVLSQESVSMQKFHHPQSVSPHKYHQGELDESEVHPVQEASSPPQTEVKPIHPEPHTQQAFIIEFFDDNPRKKRSQSFTHNSAHADSYSALKAKLERRKGLAHGERPASVHGHVPPTQQITVPLKGSSHGGSQRSSSLKREKTEDSGTSTSLLGTSSRSSPAITIKPFGSVGKKSKLAQEFTAEFLKDTGKTSSPPMSAPPVMMSPSHTLLPSPAEPPGPSSVSYPSSPSQLPALSQSLLPATSPVSAPSQTPGRSPVSSASLLCSAGSPVPPFSPLLVSGVETKGSSVTRTEEEDSLSDAGTYTIETESQDKEVEEARSMIDQVFGVLDAPEYSGQTLGVYRPVIDDGKDEQLFLSHSHGMAADVMSTSSQGHGGDQVISLQAHPEVGGPKWVSRWASLADTYSDPGSTQGSMGIPPQSGPGDRDDSVTSTISQSLDFLESEGSQVSRTRRLLPQVPPGEKMENSTPSILIRHESNMDHEPPEKGSRAPQQQYCTQRLRVQDDVDPDSLSDTSRSDDSSILDRSGRSQGKRGTTIHSPSENVNHSRGLRELPTPTPKPTSFYIGSEDGSCKSDVSKSPVLLQPERDSFPKIPPTTVLIRHLSGHESRRPVKPNSSAPNLQTHNRDVVPTKETAMSFVRQESFTKDRPSDNIQVKKLPHISSHPALRSLDTEEAVRDTFPYPKEAEKSLTSPEEKLPESSQRSKKGSCPAQEDSLSGDSDVDTASTVSMVSNKNAPVGANKKHTSAGDMRKEKSSSGLQDKARQPTARERLSEKRRNHAPADNTNKAELSCRLQLRRSAGNRGSLDLSDNQHGQQLLHEAAASEHESSSRPNSRKKLTAPLQKEDPNKMTKGSQQVLTRSNSLSAPRPTRASMLRRARLGETSDNEGAETDRASQSSDHSKTTAEGKKLSRLDILAMPRKRTRSFTVPSDNESTSSKHGISNRPTEANSSVRKGASSEVRQATSKGAASVGKHSTTRTRSNQVKHSSTTGSHRRQKNSDYSSTSEEEFETNSKHKRSHASASTQTQTPQKTIHMRLKCGSFETEEDETQNEHFQNWSTHSAEIARLSQDLAKDLAILAREIHDVAGDGDSQTSSGMGATTSPGSMPNTPASTISTREERPYASLQRFLLPQLVQHIPEASLNYQKVPPGSTSPIDQDSNMNDHDSSRRRPWNREEVILDNLMLNPVSQLSQAIRENTEQLAEKMKALFHNKTEVWEEIEAKINAENDVPILKTSNKQEISSILQELRRVQRQLEVINTIVEPGGILKIHPMGTSPGGKTKSASKEFSSPTSANANASAKRGPRGPEGGRYVV